MSNPNPFAIVAADAKAAVDAVTGGLRWFAAEARLAIGWIDQELPGAQTALAALFQAADAAAGALEASASSGLADVVAGAVEEAGGTVANLISASGLDLTAKAVLTAADVAAVTAAQSIAHNAIGVATARCWARRRPARRKPPRRPRPADVAPNVRRCRRPGFGRGASPCGAVDKPRQTRLHSPELGESARRSRGGAHEP
jgi:hypothetical protein